MSAGTKITRLPARRAAVISSRAIAPPPMPTIVRLACTIAVEVGDSADEPGRRPPQVVSRTKNTSSTHFDSATPCSRASTETMPIVAKPMPLASS